VTPDLRHVRYFLAVAEELNFTRAAERLFVGQQAVSKSVRQLERELGVTLLERTSHDVALTPAGADCCAKAETLLRPSTPRSTVCAASARARSAR
jgi:DNA-binding transcriptional LysR family regulator